MRRVSAWRATSGPCCSRQYARNSSGLIPSRRRMAKVSLTTLRLAAGHRRQDHQRVAVAHRRVEAVEHPHVLVVEIDVDVAVEVAVGREDLRLRLRVRLAQG